MASTPDPIPLIGPSDMQVVERVLDMRSGYVLDLNNREFDDFIAHEVGIDATALSGRSGRKGAGVGFAVRTLVVNYVLRHC